TTKHSSIVAIKREVKPIPFFALDNEFCRVGEICCTRSVIARLRDYVDHQIPGSRLTYLRQRASECLLFFVRGSESGHRCDGCRDQPGNIAPGQHGTAPRGGARRLSNNGLPCGESV